MKPRKTETDSLPFFGGRPFTATSWGDGRIEFEYTDTLRHKLKMLWFRIRWKRVNHPTFWTIEPRWKFWK